MVEPNTNTNGNDWQRQQESLLVEGLKELKECLMDQEDFARAVEICEETLLVSFPCEMIYEIYAKSLLHLEEYSKLVEQVKAPSAGVRSILEPLQVYAMYRLEQYDRVLKATNTSTTSAATASASGASSAAVATLQHVKAQSLFRIHDTQNALMGYEGLLKGKRADEEISPAQREDLEELTTEVLTNALAILAANATPYGNFPQSDNNGTPDIYVQWIKQAQGILQNRDSQEKSYPYDLAYNLASLQLLSSHTTSSRQQAQTLLQKAFKRCSLQTQNDPIEVQPILLQQQWSRAFWEDYAFQTKNSSHKSGHNQLNGLLSHANPLLLADPKSKLLPPFMEKILHMPKTTPLQARLASYNLALVLLHGRQYEKCREILRHLSQPLAAATSKYNGKNKKNKKASSVVSTTSATAVSPPSELDALWWQSRIDVLLAYSFRYSVEDKRRNNDDDEDKEEKQLEAALQSLKDHQTVLQDTASTGMRDHILTYISMHLQHLTESDSGKREEWLRSQKHFPAIVASLAQIYQNQNEPTKAQEVLSESGAAIADTMLAEMAMARGDYNDAVNIYERAIKVADKNENDIAVKARFVEALSHVDPRRALREWELINDDIKHTKDDDDGEAEDNEVDGEALETQELPRLHRQHLATTDALVGLSGQSSVSASSKRKKRQGAVLRRRAKQRQAYLEKLQQEGLYSPSKPVKPDPERWMPKAERQRRRRRGAPQSKASQGGMLTANEAAQLDVAARASGQTGVKAHSTAHMSVAGGDARGKNRRR